MSTVLTPEEKLLFQNGVAEAIAFVVPVSAFVSISSGGKLYHDRVIRFCRDYLLKSPQKEVVKNYILSTAVKREEIPQAVFIPDAIATDKLSAYPGRFRKSPS